MTLFSLEHLISNLAIEMKCVGSAYAGASVYDVNSLTARNYPLIYTSPTGTQDIQVQTTTYEFTIFYIDRLLSDNSNDNDIFNLAVESLRRLSAKIENYPEILNFERTGITLFTEKEKFSDRCAGAYLSCKIMVANTDVCALEIEGT